MKPGKDPEMELGRQPLDRIMEDSGLANRDFVECSREQLTHKMVAKGRKGRRLTLNARKKILNALNTCQKKKKYSLSELFNYD